MDANREPSPDLEVVYVKEPADRTPQLQKAIWGGRGMGLPTPQLSPEQFSTSARRRNRKRDAEEITIIDESDPLELTWSDLVREAVENSEGTSSEPAPKCERETPARPSKEMPVNSEERSVAGPMNDSAWSRGATYPRQCEMCSQGFAPLHFLLETPNKNATGKPGTCETCGERVLKVNHGGKSRDHPSTCIKCGKGFARMPNPGRKGTDDAMCDACCAGPTLGVNNSDGNLYNCELCGKSCYTAFNLYEHSFVHFGQKPYKCEKCNKRFINVIRLEKHLKLHARRKDRTCKICNKSFLSNSAFTTHNQLHSDERFCCSKCDMTYQTKQALYKHSKIHREEKPYMCHICDESFPLLKLLRSHSMEHWQ